MKRLAIVIISVCFLLGGVGSRSFSGQLTIYTKPPVSAQDRRQDFVKDIIKAAMDHTIASHGPYEMKELPRMGWQRLSLPGTMAAYPNLVVRISGLSVGVAKMMTYIPIPINQGIVGYRIALIPRTVQENFNTISSLADLLSSGLTAGQGDWPDADILKANGLSVIVGTSYEGLFYMLNSDRFDYFPRGINEVFQEWEARKTRLPDMKVEEKIALYYPLPRILATSKGNTALAGRLEKGLTQIFSNGTHRKIWLKYNRDFIRKAELDKRKIIILENPLLLGDIPMDRDEYWYRPGESL